MDHWISSAFSYLKDKPEIIALLVVIMVLCKLLLMREKALTDLITQLMGANTILAKLATLTEVLVNRKEGSR